MAAGLALIVGFGLGGGLGGGEARPDAAGDCPETDSAEEMSGSGPGSLDSARGALLAFNHGYYVERSADIAFRAVAESSEMRPEVLQADGIDSVDENVTHCVRTREISHGLVDVMLHEINPDGSRVEIRQRAQLEETADGEWGIVTLLPVG